MMKNNNNIKSKVMEKDYLIYKLSETIKTTSRIDKELFNKFNVKRGLRNEDHSGVLVGLTKVGDVVGYEKLAEGGLKAIPGKLYYRGIDVEDLTHGLAKEDRLGFEETAFLLLSGYLPDAEELVTFKQILYNAMPLNQKATMNIIDLEGQDIMNILARSVLELYTFDPNPDDISRDNLIRQSIDLIAKFPTIIAYAYNILRHSQQGRSLHIRHPNEDMSIAENFLYMMKGPNNYTDLDVKILDLTLILHADHGGGNNSTFTVRVTSSTQTDTYSSIAAGIGSLKGPLHGGANIKVVQMFEHLKTAIKDWTNVKEIDNYLKKMLNKEAYNKSGLIYGIGHAVYTISDPRALVLKEMARQMAVEKGLQKEFAFLELIDERAVKAFMGFKGDDINKQVCTNVDFYSGFVYDAIGLPTEVFTPLFAMARITGWTAHRIEELNFGSKRIIRPAYKNVGEPMAFVPLKDR
jgi:citrate synthase